MESTQPPQNNQSFRGFHRGGGHNNRGGGGGNYNNNNRGGYQRGGYRGRGGHFSHPHPPFNQEQGQSPRPPFQFPTQPSPAASTPDPARPPFQFPNQPQSQPQSQSNND